MTLPYTYLHFGTWPYVRPPVSYLCAFHVNPRLGASANLVLLSWSPNPWPDADLYASHPGFDCMKYTAPALQRMECDEMNVIQVRE
jgi:hypothetical protein